MAAAQAVVREHQEQHLQVFFLNCANIYFEYITLIKKKIKWPRPRQ